MADVEALLRSTMRRHATHAPVGPDLLAAVHARSHRIARRRRTAVTVLAAVAVPAALAVSVLTAVPRDAAPPGSVAVVPSTGTTPVSAPASSSPAATPPGQPPPALRLVPPASATPVFPYRPVFTPIGGLAAPVVTLVDGELTAYYAAHDPVRGADVTIRVSARAPEFTDPGRPFHQTPQRVRGHPAVLRTVVMPPADRLSLYWMEGAGQWVRVDTDDTLTDADVVRLADALAPAAVPVVVPFRFDVVPAGMTVNTSTDSEVAFGVSAGAPAVDCTLLAPRALTGPTVRVGRYAATLRRTGAAATLTVALDDLGATLVVVVPARYPVTNADLIRFARGIQVTSQAQPRPTG
ncbi:MAG: hypothetical protein AUG44_21135 [Actinobacteria bacterium 13_1_20CM_3_71_11]|nr:MAG: hypothetical protein AUG44_21135 [Actinobacteria bacterium 13_1_20CM_3_71_11]